MANDKIVKSKSDATLATQSLVDIMGDFAITPEDAKRISDNYAMERFIQPAKLSSPDTDENGRPLNPFAIEATLEKLEVWRTDEKRGPIYFAVVRSTKNARRSLRFLVSGGMSRDLTPANVGRIFYMEHTGFKVNPAPNAPTATFDFAWLPVEKKTA